MIWANEISKQLFRIFLLATILLDLLAAYVRSYGVIYR
jgi:hypothetical protein